MYQSMVYIAVLIVVVSISTVLVLLQESGRLRVQPSRSPTVSADEDSFKQRIFRLYDSTAFWTAIAMVGGLIAARYSTQIVLVVAVGILTSEVWKVKFFENTLPRLSSCVMALVIFSAIAIIMWPYLKPTPADQSVIDAFKKNFPWLASPPSSLATPYTPKIRSTTKPNSRSSNQVRKDALEIADAVDKIYADYQSSVAEAVRKYQQLPEPDRTPDAFEGLRFFREVEGNRTLQEYRDKYRSIAPVCRNDMEALLGPTAHDESKKRLYDISDKTSENNDGKIFFPSNSQLSYLPEIALDLRTLALRIRK